jgi:Glycogen recognition site of AMP-activated protein kinase
LSGAERFQTILLEDTQVQIYKHITRCIMTSFRNIKFKLSSSSISIPTSIPNHPSAMGNQYSTVQDKLPEKDVPQRLSRHEKQRSRTISTTPLPPTETKINAEQASLQDRRKSSTVKEAVKNLTLESLPPPRTEREILKEVVLLEQTPRFETLRVGSSSSVLAEVELKEIDKRTSEVGWGITDEVQVPLVLDWNDGGKDVSVAGTFTGWRKRINLRKTYPA